MSTRAEGLNKAASVTTEQEANTIALRADGKPMTVADGITGGGAAALAGNGKVHSVVNATPFCQKPTLLEFAADRTGRLFNRANDSKNNKLDRAKWGVKWFVAAVATTAYALAFSWNIGRLIKSDKFAALDANRVTPYVRKHTVLDAFADETVGFWKQANDAQNAWYKRGWEGVKMAVAAVYTLAYGVLFSWNFGYFLRSEGFAPQHMNSLSSRSVKIIDQHETNAAANLSPAAQENLDKTPRDAEGRPPKPVGKPPVKAASGSIPAEAFSVGRQGEPEHSLVTVSLEPSKAPGEATVNDNESDTGSVAADADGAVVSLIPYATSTVESVATKSEHPVREAFRKFASLFQRSPVASEASAVTVIVDKSKDSKKPSDLDVLSVASEPSVMNDKSKDSNEPSVELSEFKTNVLPRVEKELLHRAQNLIENWQAFNHTPGIHDDTLAFDDLKREAGKIGALLSKYAEIATCTDDLFALVAPVERMKEITKEQFYINPILKTEKGDFVIVDRAYNEVTGSEELSGFRAKFASLLSDQFFKELEDDADAVRVVQSLSNAINIAGQKGLLTKADAKALLTRLRVDRYIRNALVGAVARGVFANKNRPEAVANAIASLGGYVVAEDETQFTAEVNTVLAALDADYDQHMETLRQQREEAEQKRAAEEAAATALQEKIAAVEKARAAGKRVASKAEVAKNVASVGKSLHEATVAAKKALFVDLDQLLTEIVGELAVLKERRESLEQKIKLGIDLVEKGQSTIKVPMIQIGENGEPTETGKQQLTLSKALDERDAKIAQIRTKVAETSDQLDQIGALDDLYGEEALRRLQQLSADKVTFNENQSQIRVLRTEIAMLVFRLQGKVAGAVQYNQENNSKFVKADQQIANARVLEISGQLTAEEAALRPNMKVASPSAASAIPSPVSSAPAESAQSSLSTSSTASPTAAREIVKAKRQLEAPAASTPAIVVYPSTPKGTREDGSNRMQPTRRKSLGGKPSTLEAITVPSATAIVERAQTPKSPRAELTVDLNALSDDEESDYESGSDEATPIVPTSAARSPSAAKPVEPPKGARFGFALPGMDGLRSFFRSKPAPQSPQEAEEA